MSLSYQPYTLAAATAEYRRLVEEQARLEIIGRAWRYYNGAHRKPLEVKQGQADDNVIINLSRFLVNKGASFLFGKGIEWELVEGEHTPAEEWLDAVWRKNRKATLLNKIAISGGVTGHVFCKLVPPEVGGLPRIVSVDPEYVTVQYSADDYEDVWRYQIEWVEYDKDQRALERKQDIARDDAGRWHIVNYIARGGGRYVQDGPDVIWGWPWSPIVDCQNMINPGSFWGLSDLEDLSEQDAINYVASKIQRILRYHAHPKTVGAGFRPDDIKVAEDETIVLPSSESRLENLEMQSDLGAAMGFMDRLINLWMRTERVPNLDPAQVSVGALSGFALKVLYGDLLEKTEVKRATYGDLLIELNRRLLDMGGYGPKNYVTLYWPSPLPEDWQEQKARDEFELQNQVASVETVRARRGLNNEAENERIDAEQTARNRAEGNIGAMLVQDFFTNRRPEEGA